MEDDEGGVPYAGDAHTSLRRLGIQSRASPQKGLQGYISSYLGKELHSPESSLAHRSLTAWSRGWESDIPPLTLSIRPRDPAEGLLLYSPSPPPHSLSITTPSPNLGANASLTSSFPLQPRPPAYPRARPGFSTPPSPFNQHNKPCWPAYDSAGKPTFLRPTLPLTPFLHS